MDNPPTNIPLRKINSLEGRVKELEERLNNLISSMEFILYGKSKDEVSRKARQAITTVLIKNKGDVAMAAEELGRSVGYLRERMEMLGLSHLETKK